MTVPFRSSGRSTIVVGVHRLPVAHPGDAMAIQSRAKAPTNRAEPRGAGGEDQSMSYDSNNIFAKILRGEAPAFRVCETASALAFMDLMPQVPGHTLVIPKDNAEGLHDADPEILGSTIQLVQTVAAAVKQAFEAPGIMIAQLNGPAAGQTVFHLHFHILPRFSGLELKLHAREVEEAAVLQDHAARIRACLRQTG